MSLELYATVSGSFRKYLSEIGLAANSLRRAGVHVLSPRNVRPVHEVGTFVYVEGDRGSPSDVEIAHLDAIRRSDFLYIVNPEGYIGTSSALEMGFARALSVPMFCQEKPCDVVLESLLQYGLSPAQVAETMAAKKRSTSISVLREGASLRDVQASVAELVKQKGFAEESMRDVALLFMEEAGELARAIRKRTGLKTRPGAKRSKAMLAGELADCLIYIVDLANLGGVDIEGVLREKLIANSRRSWR